VQHTVGMISAGQLQARQLVNIAYGVARSGGGQHMDALMASLAKSLKQRLHDCNAQELANAAWAFAKTGKCDRGLFKVLARAAESRADSFKAQELANIAWAFATAGHPDEKLFTELARVVGSNLDYFSAQGLANTAWAFAKVGHSDAKLFAALATSAEWLMNDFNAQDLAHTAGAFARAGHLDEQLFAALAASTERRLGDFNAQGLANVAWAFAKANKLDAKLSKALAQSTVSRMSSFNAQDLANISWAFAKACHVDAELFSALARSSERRLTDFNAQDLVNTAWAFAKIGLPDAQLFAALARAAERRLEDFSAQNLANIAWAFAKAGQQDAKLFTALARTAEGRLEDFGAEDLANIAWAFANAGNLDTQLFVALARSVERYIDDLKDEDLDNTAWAFATAGQKGIAKRLRQRMGEADSVTMSLTASPDTSKCGRIVIAGGGIGGAAVAVALQSKGFDVVVLESDSCLDARKQGYGLTIQKLGTIQALGISLEEDDAPSTSHYTFSAEGNVLGAYGDAFRQDQRTSSSSGGRFVHIPRQALRARIVDRIRPGTIRWNSKLDSFSCWSDHGDPSGERKANGVTVTLTDGTTMDAALLVGADGIFSTVRRQLSLPGDRLNYLGLIVVLGYVPTGGPSGGLGDDGGTQSATAFPLTERRIFETVDGVTRIYAMPFTKSVTMWQLSFPYAEKAARKLVRNPAALKEEILKRCAEWHDPVPALLANTPLDCMSGYPVYDRDPLDPGVLRSAAAPPGVGVRLPPQRRVTVMGDAAHPMSPFRAQGANQALGDAVLLAEALWDGVRVHGPDAGLDAALPEFERKMLGRSARMVIGSREKAKEMHSNLALQPARKVQRESGVDMSEIIKVLQAKGIGAHSAADPRGLDAVVAEFMRMSDPGGSPAVRDKAKANVVTDHSRKTSSLAVDRRGVDEKRQSKALKQRLRRQRCDRPQTKRAEQGVNDTEARKRRKTADSASEAKAIEHRHEERQDQDWWKTLMFDGFTGEEWEAWYAQGRAVES